MASNTYTQLATLRPTDTNEAELYEVAADEYIVATLHICNQSAVDRTYSVAITEASGAAADDEWVRYDFPLYANISNRLTIACGDGNTVRVKASVADLISFVLTGLKVT